MDRELQAVFTRLIDDVDVQTFDDRRSLEGRAKKSPYAIGAGVLHLTLWIGTSARVDSSFHGTFRPG